MLELVVTVLRSLIAAIALALLCCAAVHVMQRDNTVPTSSGPASPNERSPAVPPGTVTRYG